MYNWLENIRQIWPDFNIDLVDHNQVCGATKFRNERTEVRIEKPIITFVTFVINDLHTNSPQYNN